MINDQPVDVSVCPGETAVFSLATDGTAPLSYQWRKDGLLIPGANQASYSIDPVIASDASYDCLVSNDCSFATSTPAILSVKDPLSVSIQPTSIAQGLEPIWLNVAIGCSLPEVQWEWQNLSTGEFFGSNQESVIINPMVTESAVFEVTATDAQGTNTARAIVLVPSNSLYLDYNGDGRNTIEDLYLFLQDWLEAVLAADDPNEDGFINILDTFYINTMGTGVH